MDIGTIILTVILVWAFMLIGYFHGYIKGVEVGRNRARRYFQAVQDLKRSRSTRNPNVFDTFPPAQVILRKKRE